MQYYTCEGFIKDENWVKENDSRQVKEQRTKEIAYKSDTFNRKLRGKAFFYVVHINNGSVKMGIIAVQPINIETKLSSYLRAIGLDLKDVHIEETTFEKTQSNLHFSGRNDFIEDDDEVIDSLNLRPITFRFDSSLTYGENITETDTRENIYADAERFLAKESFVPELDRIYSPAKVKHTSGHPVHYMVITDDHTTRRELCRLLVKALHDNGRIANRRYSYLDFCSESRFSFAAYDCLYESSIGGTVIVRFEDEDEEEEREFATAGRAVIEQLCKTMKKHKNDVLTIFCVPRASVKYKDLFREYLDGTSIIEISDDFVSGDRAVAYLKMLAKDNKIRPDKKLAAKVKDSKNYLAPDLRKLFDDWYSEKVKRDFYPQYAETAVISKKAIKKAHKGSAYDELSEMIGLTRAKKVITDAINYHRAQRMFEDKGMPQKRTTMHMVFTGNPGTAKTTVARLFGRIMQENHILTKGHFVEVGRKDLVGMFVGWTAQIIKKKFKEAKGGVLFIDEAYSLVDGHQGSYGDEAINTIVQEMENNRNDLVVIFAGYPAEMEQFLDRNPGLRSRIAFHVPFDDYDSDELCDIARLTAKKDGLKLTDGAYEKLHGIFDTARLENDFGNGRYVRNILDKAKMTQATRLIELDPDSVSKDDLTTICAEDIEMPETCLKNTKHAIGFST